MDVTWCLLLLAAGLSGMQGIYGEYDDDRDKLSDKEIKEKLELLTNEVMQLKKEVQEIRGLKNKGEKKDKATQLNILSTSRKSLSDGQVLYTVRYQEPKNSSTLKPIWRKYENHTYILIPETISNAIPNLPLGVRETCTTTTPHNKTHLMVLLGSRNHWISLFLDNESEDDVTETDIETPLLDITPKGDIVYDLGHNATFNVTIPPPPGEREEPGGSILDTNNNIDTTFVFAEPGSMTLRTKFDSDDELFHLEEETKFFDKAVMAVNINTATTPYSGVLEIYSGVVRKNGLIKRIEHHKEIIVRPTTQNGPFLEGKIYKRLLEAYDTKRNENGDIVRQCTYGRTCTEYCQFFGGDLTSLQLLKTVNGETTVEPLQVLDEIDVSYQKTGMFEVSPKEGDPFPVTYTCRVANVEGQTAAYNSVVVFGYDVKILINETSVEMFNNETGRIVCTARGLPLPKITVQCGYIDEKPDVLYQTDDVISVTATCKNINPWNSITCSAENDFQTDYFY